jgi:hypothetical protein
LREQGAQGLLTKQKDIEIRLSRANILSRSPISFSTSCYMLAIFFG